ncbi:helix-turn-helix domain-containing protein [Spirosoma spitsbergense]|uniref:helix-turn-helix domain-containing protein n=1 Tax=Spirosoma spitsbergense TaxID=431554 RepID=UPI0003AB2DBD|nr:AraC family transcriptional regulator [Spirosoma spitsbergense]
MMELPKPMHPLISLVDYESIKREPFESKVNLKLDFYSISLKTNFNGKVKYGQLEYDFDEGIFSFIAPKQVFRVEFEKGIELKLSGWLLLIHPDFLWGTALAKKIKQYEFFSYDANEALFLSDKEEKKIIEIIKNIEQEYHSNIDNFSQSVIIAELDLLLTYSDRFYNRQFITRKKDNHRILNQLDTFLTGYFNNVDLAIKGIPTVELIAGNLNISANYLSHLLKMLTGQSTKQFIHDKLIDLAKEKLSTTDLSVNEIAYSLGFEHPQSFSKLFKSKTNFSPIEFRQSFN